MSKQAVCDAIKKLQAGEPDAWVTISGRRYRIGSVDKDAFAGGCVILATSHGYEVVELFQRKGYHTGGRWQVLSRRRRAYWTSVREIRALVLEGHERDRASKRGLLFEVLKMVATAPEGQLRPDFTARARALSSSTVTTPESVHAFFAEVWSLTDADASSFVRAMVDPKFTKEYS